MPELGKDPLAHESRGCSLLDFAALADVTVAYVAHHVLEHVQPVVVRSEPTDGLIYAQVSRLGHVVRLSDFRLLYGLPRARLTSYHPGLRSLESQVKVDDDNRAHHSPLSNPRTCEVGVRPPVSVVPGGAPGAWSG